MDRAVLTCLLLTACQPRGVSLPVDSGDSGISDTHDSGSDDTGVEHIPDAWEPPVYDPYALPEDVPRVNIQLEPGALARLDADPFHAADELGVFIDGDGAAHEVEISYRGAYALLSVMNNYDLRNWKVKFDGDDRYLDRREWNFNYEPHFQQKLAYDLMRFAGLAVPGAQHVILELNGEYQGVYLQYEDPDNDHLLVHELGDDRGDLYKAAYDLPYEPQYFADLTVLGDSDEDYLLHYNKKQGEDDDVSVLRGFIDELNQVPDADFADWLEHNVDVDRFRSYLVVSNFMANWDSYPQRPKNYWLYEDRRAERMVYIPWDMDGTFGPYADGSYNQMGTDASVLYNLFEQEYVPPHDDEGWDRPLVHRMMAIPEQEEAYLARYRELAASILNDAYLSERLDALTAMVEPELSSTDQQRLRSYEIQIRTFIERRSARVEEELTGL
jgi:spore coat protein CotH